MPWVHGLRDRVSVGCSIRAAHRADESRHRATSPAAACRTLVSPTALLGPALSSPPARDGTTAGDRWPHPPLAAAAATAAREAPKHADARPVGIAREHTTGNCRVHAGVW